MTARLPPSYLKRCRTDLWFNGSVCRHGQFEGFLVTSKNSGTHWMAYMLAVALADTYGVPRPAYFSERALRPYIRLPKDPVVHAPLPALGRSHSIPHRLLDWGWARAMISPAPYILGVRHPMGILASHYAKWRDELKVSWTEYLRGDPSGDRYRCDLYWIARFWNRWGELQALMPEAILRLHYEDLQDRPAKLFEAIQRHWKLALAPEAVEAALNEGTKEAMAARLDPDGEANVLQNRRETLDALFEGEAGDIYAGLVSRLFRYQLGYDLMRPPVPESRSSGLRAHS
jgi:hypothetical protein